MNADRLDSRYQILSTLGQGGMGDVYLAQNLELNRLEAVKLLKPKIAEAFASRFRREARAMNRLRHPNIINIYDFGRLSDGRAYLAMEYAEGHSVQLEIEKEKRLDIDRSIALLRQLADALEHAHGQGVIHRDLKPANLILCRARNGSELMRILDFGVAKIIAPGYQDSVGATGNVIYATPGYIAPEFLYGDGDEPRSDIYSLGCIGFEMVAGRPPFEGRRMDVCHAHVSSQPPRPNEAIGEEVVPKPLEDVILWCLEKNPEDRPQTGAEVIDALDGVAKIRRQQRRRGLPSTMRGPKLRIPPFARAATDIDSGLATDEEAVEARARWRAALQSLAEHTIDAGCADATLVIALTAASRAHSDVERTSSELRALAQQRANVDQQLRNREASLRNSLAELNYARQRTVAAGTDPLALEHAIGDIGLQLRELQQQCNVEEQRGDHRASQLQRQAAELEITRNDAYWQLDDLLQSLADHFRHVPAIDALLAQVAETRPEDDRLTEPVQRGAP